MTSSGPPMDASSVSRLISKGSPMRISVPLTLQTRLGRRIALLFVLSALLPIAVMTVQGYFAVRARAIADARGELSRVAKNIGMGFIGQLAGGGDILRGAPGDI